ncbi:hypothetical protein CONCODRAFT_18832 [Conidiobolus coronatus NRRL 28638]|uniref:Uncharacterized protein n=1 Tax=Conidiobolus coronatus (strain ATCC 28846 / CBS 209.66 / NRRL 28638) TaxID=796925 RepID=A0A137P0Y0_CONC2|nr:hypothetical protein CONCODRAFT_18832 [Conidiobolus coronatus NRRL 28638]|eukprot:KXN68726.1 hypothetical protein CONCODRAFT_18832 [Conidiobolus coronatus NRRL 28638]
MSNELTYRIFCKTHEHLYYTLEDSVGNRLLFSWNNCSDPKLTIKGSDLALTKIIENDPPVIVLGFPFETAFDNMKFSLSAMRKYKVKGNYYSNKLEEINWRWKSSSFWSSTFTLVDKKNNGKELAKIKGFTLAKELSGSFTISDGVPSELHNLIIVSGCLLCKEMQAMLIPKLNSYYSDPYLIFNFPMGTG